MPIISKEAAQRHLDMWMEAEAAVSTGQSYQIEQMMLTRASLKQIRESIMDGKYFVDQMEHSISPSSGYKTQVKASKVEKEDFA